MDENEGILLPAIERNMLESKSASPKLTRRPTSLTGHVFLSPQTYAQKSKHIDLDEDIHRLSIGSPSHCSPASCRRASSEKEPESNAHQVRGHQLSRSRPGSPLSHSSQSPASTPGLRRRKLEHKISPLAGDELYLCDSVSDLRPRSRSFSGVNRLEVSRAFKSKLATAASRDSLDVGLSRFDVRDNVHHSDQSHENPATDIPVETLEKCKKWLEGVAQAGGLERPLNAVIFNNIEWSDG